MRQAAVGDVCWPGDGSPLDRAVCVLKGLTLGFMAMAVTTLIVRQGSKDVGMQLLAIRATRHQAVRMAWAATLRRHDRVIGPGVAAGGMPSASD